MWCSQNIKKCGGWMVVVAGTISSFQSWVFAVVCCSRCFRWLFFLSSLSLSLYMYLFCLFHNNNFSFFFVLLTYFEWKLLRKLKKCKIKAIFSSQGIKWTRVRRTFFFSFFCFVRFTFPCCCYFSFFVVVVIFVLYFSVLSVLVASVSVSRSSFHFSQ